jgi:hypothetical protein
MTKAAFGSGMGLGVLANEYGIRTPLTTQLPSFDPFTTVLSAGSGLQ